ncbi:MAG TPA: hypothetical protein VD963_04530 [Phycisphaerales bacterium]|nr:hypothetical protein [Phycisphaerales bacterium]
MAQMGARANGMELGQVGLRLVGVESHRSGDRCHQEPPVRRLAMKKVVAAERGETRPMVASGPAGAARDRERAGCDEGGFDLRRRRSPEVAERMASRAEYLPAGESSLVRAVFGDGRAVGELASLLGERPAVLRRRVRRISKRVLGPVFAFVAVRRDEWPATMRKVGTACFLHGISIRRVAVQQRLSLHVVRQHRDAVLALYRAEAGAGRRDAGGGGRGAAR